MPSATSRSSGRSESLGSQRPRIGLVPNYVSTAGQEAVEVYELTGQMLDPWQRDVLRDSMGERSDGRWAATDVGIVVARQNGKDEILCARELWGLFVGGERLLMHSAHKFDTAMEHLERLVNLIDGVPEFARRVRTVNRSHGQEGITLRSGARIRFRARTRSGGFRGYTGNCIIFNEAMDLPDEIAGAVMPALSARSMERPGPQTYFAGSAVDQETMANGLVLARIREAGAAGENGRLAYFEWSAPDDADPADWDARAAANPGMGYRIAPEYIETEFQSPAMSARQFRVERLGIGDWPDTSEDAGRIISREDWAAVAERDPANRITGTAIFSADANPSMTWASIAVSGKRADGLFNGAVVERRQGTDWIIGRALELKREHPRCRFVIHKQGPLGSHIDDFKRAKIRVIEANTEDYSRACTGFVAGVLERRFRYPFPQPELDEALASARKKETAESTKWTRADADSPDISPLVAVTLAYWGAEQAKSGARIVSWNDIPED